MSEQIVINALSLGALYALVALGFTLIFGVAGMLNFAHGALVTTGAFTVYMVANPRWLGYSPWVGAVVGAAVAALFGAALYRSILDRIQDRPVIVLVVTLVFGFILENLYRIFISDTTITAPRLVSGTVALAGIEVQSFRLFIFLTSWVSILLVFYFVNWTTIGKAVTATSMSDRGALLVGINTDRINLITWAIASAFAGLAGVLLLMLQSGSWHMGTSSLIISFAIVILGGLGSIRGSIVGAYLIGFSESVTVLVIDPKLEGLSSLLILLVVLFVRPQGLFGREEVG
jgi:branched-chain amino acid transport system permease protein